MKEITQKRGGSDLLLQGNEAIARGALEGGVVANLRGMVNK